MTSFISKVVFLSLFLFSSYALAQGQDAAWNEKSVWTITYVKTKAGVFNEYIKDLSGFWRALVEQQKKDGKVLSYKILNVAYPRDGEPDLLILVEYKNMAALDNDLQYTEQLLKEVNSNFALAENSAVERDRLRDFRGIVLTREIDFRK
ncbi:hypothetical protein ACSFA7_00390 [Variovorax sp. LT1R20]|uniref:hypothetical protein n=1 Tax=Variovorax sp. LT1R20 TaxID=3443729 RepID=UPI003F4888D2